MDTLVTGLPLCKKSRTPLKKLHNELPCKEQEPSIDIEAIYDNLKMYFHRSAQVRIVGRTAERAVIQNFWSAAINGNGLRCLYVCGNPGTGKTGLIDEMIAELLVDTNMMMQCFKVNCMMYTDPREALLSIACNLKVPKSKTKGDSDKYDELIKEICEKMKKSKKTFVLVLDEIDQIAVKSPALLEAIFKIPYHTDVNVIVIGIANALDLSIKYFTPSIEQLQVLNFAPYTPEDIGRILMARSELAMTNNQEDIKASENNTKTSSMITAMAMEICARKVSAVSDLRKALEIMQDAIKLTQKEAFKDNKLVKVDTRHVMFAMETVFGATVRTTSRHAQIIQDLNLHQKLLLATLYRLLIDGVGIKLTVQSLFDRYTANTRIHRLVDAVSRSEFNDLLSNTESMGILMLIAPGKRTKGATTVTTDTKISLLIPLEDLRVGLSSNPLLQSLL